MLAVHFARFILENAHKFVWSLQGLGMFRLYLSQQRRLHVWAPSFAFKDVSTIHTHPWKFESSVISGHVTDVVFEEAADGGAAPMHRQKIICGPGGCAVGECTNTFLRERYRRTVRAGECYSLASHEIHESRPAPGTITLIDRTFGVDTEHAYVFFPHGTPWVSAEPRTATGDEVDAMKRIALDRLG